MVVLRRLMTIFQTRELTHSFYARKFICKTSNNMKQVHQEALRYVSPSARIKVDSDIFIKVTSADPHIYRDGDAFIAQLHGDPVKNCTASMDVKVSDDECDVVVVVRKISDSTNFHCELSVPLRASLEINTRDVAEVSNINGDELKVRANKFINTNNIRAEKIELFSAAGDINCQGILLGIQTSVEAQNGGNITLDKLQGKNMKCKTDKGEIITKCSYVESSRFETETGSLNLQNVHKKSEVVINQKGHLKMSGVHGNLKVLMNAGTMDIQLSVLEGQSVIDVKNLSSCIINISEDIEKDTSLDITLSGNTYSPAISLESTLKYLSLALSENMRTLKWPLDQERSNKFKVISNNSLTLRKSSWIDAMRLEIAGKQNK